MMAAEVSNQSYAHVGIPDAFHPLSHHAESKAAMEKLVIVQKYHTQVFCEFMQKLEKIPDGDGSVLDNSIFLYGGNMSNSNAHNQFPLPTLVFGRGAGKIKGNQHLRLSGPHAAREPAVHAAAARRRAGRQGRRQPRRADRGLRMPRYELPRGRPCAARGGRRRARAKRAARRGQGQRHGARAHRDRRRRGRAAARRRTAPRRCTTPSTTTTCR